MTRPKPGCAPLALLLLAVSRGTGHEEHGAEPHLFTSHCAALKLCNRPLEERSPEVNAVPPEDAGEAPQGHLRPVGHPDFAGSWAGGVEVVWEMSPKDFWRRYWPRKPFLLKGFARRSPAFTKWREDRYLAESFGEYRARCRPRNEDRLANYCGTWTMGTLIRCKREALVPHAETYMNISQFIAHMRNASFDKDIVTQMPDAMGRDFVVPNFHSCGRRDSADPGPKDGGRWMTQMYENTFRLSYNEGRNFSSSVIRYDMNHQITCLFDGAEEWIMWDLSTQAHRIPMWSNHYDRSLHRTSASDDSPVDPERVDLEAWPHFREARWMNATLEAGDCLYTPALLLHYVRSWGRSVAATTTFQQEEQYDPGCGGEKPGQSQPLDAYDVLWSFPEEDPALYGWNVVKMGYPNWKSGFLRALVNKARRRDGHLTQQDFVKHLSALSKSVGGLPDLRTRATTAFSAMQAQGGGRVGPEQLYRSKDLRHLLKDLAVLQRGGAAAQAQGMKLPEQELLGASPQRMAEL